MKIFLYTLFALWVTACFCSIAGAVDTSQIQTINTREDIAIRPNGDLDYSATMTYNVNEYNRIKSQNVNPYRLVRDVRFMGEGICRDIKVTSDDAQNSYQIKSVISGPVKNMGNHWEAQMAQGYDFVSLSGDTMAFTCAFDLGAGYKIQGKAYVKAPPGSTGLSWDPENRTVRYRLPYSGRSAMERLYPTLTVIFGVVFIISALAAVRTRPRDNMRL